MDDNKRAFIIGNGETRSGFDIKNLHGKGTVFGCNALYRDYPEEYIDYLVAIDDNMITHIEASDFPSRKTIFPPEKERWEPEAYTRAGRRSNAGMNAMMEAIKRGNTTLYCLGFDFIVDGETSISNIYDGQPGYEQETRASLEDSIRRVEYLNWFVLNFSHVKFVFVIPRMGYKIHSISSDNVFGMYYDDFEKIINDETVEPSDKD